MTEKKRCENCMCFRSDPRGNGWCVYFRDSMSGCDAENCQVYEKTESTER